MTDITSPDRIELPGGWYFLEISPDRGFCSLRMPDGAHPPQPWTMDEGRVFAAAMFVAPAVDRDAIARAIFGAVTYANPNAFHPAFEYDAEVWLAAADAAIARIRKGAAHPVTAGREAAAPSTFGVEANLEYGPIQFYQGYSSTFSGTENEVAVPHRKRMPTPPNHSGDASDMGGAAPQRSPNDAGLELAEHIADHWHQRFLTLRDELPNPPSTIQRGALSYKALGAKQVLDAIKEERARLNKVDKETQI